MTSKMVVDLVIEDEVALNAIASGAQCTLSQLDGSRPILQVSYHHNLYRSFHMTAGFTRFR